MTMKQFSNEITLINTVDSSDSMIGNYPFDGNANDISGAGVFGNGTVSGAVLDTDRFGNPNSCYDFDGIDDYIELADGQTPGSLSISGKEATIRGLYLKSDGLQLYIVGATSDEVHNYTMSVARDISTATFTKSSSVVAAKEANPQDVFFSSDGLKMYIPGSTGQDITYFTLSSAWDISTLSYVGEFSLAIQDTLPSGITFKPDGTKFYMVGQTNKALFQYSLGTPRDMSTASYDNKTVVVNAQDTVPTGLQLNLDGTKAYLVGATGMDISIYTLGTPRDISTATYDTVTFYLGNQDTLPQGVFFKPDGLKAYISGNATDKVYSYTLPTARSFSNPTYANGFSISAWIKPASIGETEGRILDKSSGSVGATGLNLYLTTTNKVALSLSGSPTSSSANGSVVFGDGNWYHVVVTVSSLSKVNFYINGTLSGTANQTINNISTITTISNTRIGNRSNSTDRTFDGLIDDVKIFNVALSAAQVTSLYTGTNTTSLPIPVQDRQNNMLTVSTSTEADFTMKFKGSMSDTAPNFATAQSNTNRRDYVAVKDFQNGATVAGDVGVSYAGAGSTRKFQVLANGLKWLGGTVTEYISGDVDLRWQAFNNK